MIIPAVIPKSFEHLVGVGEAIQEITPVFQIDLVDGKYAEPKSWPFNNVGMGIVSPSTITSKVILEFEVDLMIQSPEKYLDFIIKAGAERFIFHLRSTKKMKECIEKVKSFGKEVGIALTIDDNPQDIKDFVPSLDIIQCMGIKNIGKQGEKFTNHSLDLVSTVRSLYGNVMISVDGGVSIDNAQAILEAGADRLVSGSYLFGSKDNEKVDVEVFEDNFKKMINIYKKYHLS